MEGGGVMGNIREEIVEYSKQARSIEVSRQQLLATVRDKLYGKRFRILVDYNGQPYGSSKPNLKGKIFKVTDVHSINIDQFGFFIFPDGYRDGLEIHKVEFLDD
jgi:hypothetical protein